MISAMFRTQLMAYQMGTLISFLPAFLLSGFIYSIGSMPRVIQVVALFVPARYFMEVARGIFLKGIGLEMLWFNFCCWWSTARSCFISRRESCGRRWREACGNDCAASFAKNSSRRCAIRGCAAMLFMPPLIQFLIFGYAVNLDVNNAKIAWMDQDHTPESRELLSEFEGSGRFIIAGKPDNDAAMQTMMDRGQVDAVVRVLPGFARDIERGRATSVQVLLDGTNSNTASHGLAATPARPSRGIRTRCCRSEQRSKMMVGDR